MGEIAGYDAVVSSKALLLSAKIKPGSEHDLKILQRTYAGIRVKHDRSKSINSR